MQACGYTVPERKARRASAKPETVPLINPSREQAEQLQAIWNLRMVAACIGKRGTAKPNEVYATTQTNYSADRKRTRMNYSTNAHIVCRLLSEKQKKQQHKV